MKTKKESKDSPVRLSEPWRNTTKGEPREKIKQVEKDSSFKIAGYIRLSPTGDEREEGSLVSHPQRIKQFVESKNIQSGGNWGEVVDWYVDKDLSGKDMNRPSFQRLLSDISAKRVNAVIVTELSRLNRKVKDFCDVWDFFKQHNVAFFSLKENFDTSTPMGEMMLIQAMGFAQFERHAIVDRVKKGARARAERGLANGCVPLGFNLVEHRPNHREINQSEKAYVEFIFRKFLEIRRISHVIRYLNAKGYRTKESVTKKGKKIGGNRWTLSSAHNLLTNRAYIGGREVNKRFRTNNSEDLRDEEQYFYVQAQWPPLISRELFFDVQSLLEQNKKKARRYIHQYRLTGLIVCAECGANLIGKSGRGKSATYFYYGHKRKMLVHGDRHLQRCKIENVPALQLEETVISRLKDLSNDQELVAELVRSTTSESHQSMEHQKALMAAKEQERRKLDQKVNNLYDAIADESDREIRAGLSQKARETKSLLEQVEAALQTLKSEYDQANNVVDISNVMKFIQVFRNGAFDALSVSAQAEVLKERVRRLIVRNNGVYAEIFGQKPEHVWPQIEGNEIKEASNGASPRSNRSGVLTGFGLVQTEGFDSAVSPNR